MSKFVVAQGMDMFCALLPLVLLHRLSSMKSESEKYLQVPNKGTLGMPSNGAEDKVGEDEVEGEGV